eukprot:m.277772 g.277772  ORF g.277772 m.277772 type:complete len:776 (+) comp19376_c0_seq1:294-2621(+)
MPQFGIQIFGRIKPTRKAASGVEVDNDGQQQQQQDSAQKALVTFNVPRHAEDGLVNNKREVFKFRFNSVFQADSTQQQVFEAVALPVADSVLEGYNGTVFAYGQTGSGKTFTITGGAERYEDRGLIPRTLSYLFDQYKQRSEQVFSTAVSYMEIYNEAGYDLLDPKHEAAKLEDLPKVTFMEDGDGGVHLKNLSVTPVGTEEDALNALFLGDTNRMIAETPMNMASTRSHCIFTIHVTSRSPGSAVIRRAKLHLVDLAGSERIKKSGVGGTLLQEAKYINLSLHYLEQVIVALSEKSRTHIPYRNSMMTSLLRDSLGGNCKTSMIATMSLEKKSLDESISTCRFAQRVALVKNDARLNEETDPKLVIARLKSEVEQLRIQLAEVTGQDVKTGPLDEQELQRASAMVDAFVADDDPDATVSFSDSRIVRECLRLLKVRARGAGSGASPGSSEAHDSMVASQQAEVAALLGQLQEREREVETLRTMLELERQQGAAPPFRAGDQREGGQQLQQLQQQQQEEFQRPLQQQEMHRPLQQSTTSPATTPSSSRASSAATGRRSSSLVGPEREAAYEVFKRTYQHTPVINGQKRELKALYTQAKSLGETVSTQRKTMSELKGRLESIRRTRTAIEVAGSEAAGSEPDPREIECRTELEQQKASYKASLTQLKQLKHQIEHLQHLLEKAKVQMHTAFEAFCQQQQEQETAHQHHKSDGLDALSPDQQASVLVYGSPMASRVRKQPEARATPGSAGSSVSDDIAAFYAARDAAAARQSSGQQH